jgi:hypothetical protein
VQHPLLGGPAVLTASSVRQHGWLRTATSSQRSAASGTCTATDASAATKAMAAIAHRAIRPGILKASLVRPTTYHAAGFHAQRAAERSQRGSRQGYW